MTECLCPTDAVIRAELEDLVRTAQERAYEQGWIESRVALLGPDSRTVDDANPFRASS